MNAQRPGVDAVVRTANACAVRTLTREVAACFVGARIDGPGVVVPLLTPSKAALPVVVRWEVQPVDKTAPTLSVRHERGAWIVTEGDRVGMGVALLDAVAACLGVVARRESVAVLA